LRTQVWHYPSRSECLACHTSVGGWALGFNSAQLNRDLDYSGTQTNQIEALSLAGYFSGAPTNRHLLYALASATNEAVSLEYRVRSYLSANCGHCHQPGGVVSAQWDARIHTPGPQTGIINGSLHNHFGSPAQLVIAPGSVDNSILYQRIANLGSGHMPPLATSVVNAQAVALLARWITNDLPSHISYASWQSTYFGSTNAPVAAPLADPDLDWAKNYLEYLTGTIPTNAASGWGISIDASNGLANVIIPQVANRAIETQRTTNLFDANSWLPLNLPANAPFFPASPRVQIVSDTPPATPSYYRVRVFEP